MTVTYRSCDSKRKIGIGFFLKTEIEILIEAIINFTFSNEIILEKLKKDYLEVSRFPRNSITFVILKPLPTALNRFGSIIWLLKINESMNHSTLLINYELLLSLI